MESRIMATFSSRVVSSASVTWKSQDLPTIVATGAPGHGERGELGVLEGDVLHAPEEPEVLGIGARPAPLDVVNAEGVQPGAQADLVLHREGHALALSTVPQCRVVNLDQT